MAALIAPLAGKLDDFDKGGAQLPDLWLAKEGRGSQAHGSSDASKGFGGTGDRCLPGLDAR